jgi:hypothetical protein
MVKFENLWKNFPDTAQVKSQCQNRQPTKTTPFDNYCAILLSECFIKSGIDLSVLKGDRCWSHSGKKYILRAEELANSLKARALPGFFPAQKVVPSTFQSTLKDKTGVIFFKDYWQRGMESFEQRSGDHIDLWNKDEISSSSMLTRGILEFFGRVSDLNNSREIWFWEVK